MPETREAPLSDGDQRDLIALFGAAVAAINAGDWESVADLCDAGSLQQLRDQEISNLTQIEAPQTVEQVQRELPGLPRAEAERIVAQHEEHSRPEWRLRTWLPVFASVPEAESLPPREFYVRILQGKAPSARIDRMVAAGEMSATEALSARERPVTALRFTALGAVRGSDGSAIIVYRHPRHDWTHDPSAARWLDGLPEGGRALYEDFGGHLQIKFESAKRQADGTWRLVAHGDLAGASSLMVQYRGDRGHDIMVSG